MSYAAAIESLHARAGELHSAPGQPRHKFRLEEMRALVEALGHPERRFRSVLIAGTNGKGSTAATLSSILAAAGYKTGLYTSPHLSRVNERIRISGQPISDIDFARLYFRVDDLAGQLVAAGHLPAYPSFFESLTALAFEAFAEAQVDLAVLEVGMGGRLDATNVAEPLVSVITDVSLDHVEWLGDTIPLIAREKAGILRRSGVLVTLPQHPEANRAIGEVAVELNVRGVSAAEYVPPPQSFAPGEGALRNQYPLAVLGECIQVDSPLAGVHQQRNLALAIAAAAELRNHHGFEIAPAAIAEGIRHTEWPGRLERIAIPGCSPVLLDVAHNPAGAWALRAAVSALDGESPRVLIFGCMKDKAIDEMARILFPLFDRLIVVPVASPRSATVDDLLRAAAKTGVPAAPAADGPEALRLAWSAVPAPKLVVVAGSVYLVGEIRPVLVERNRQAVTLR
ncbi:MAG TPA: folylpolyglutamate synthase/dihydrofolate synthase family protein [Acidobacteriaceae bacterium]|nr:folylpolyglutamate synthase/dihydrofolate synthase family protein [Acidobacteriaceae bacterium]